MTRFVCPSPSFSESELAHRIMGCWLGKAVGGTLGMPYEGVRKTLNLTYYEPVPKEMLPNDDLDLQVIYAFLLDRMGEQPRVDRHVLSQAWPHIGMSPDEYGIVKRNLALGLKAPATGAYDNPFTRGMGAAIRTELWACLAPGHPEVAARYAYEDACMDHAGEGIYAAQFLAALEALAFVESDRETLLDAAISYIPETCELAAAIRDTRQWWTDSGDWKKVQRQLADRYLNDNFTDVIINLAYIVLGWLAGKGFGDSICIAVNCGQDTDCTGATLGALLGILDPDGIEEHWLTPIGRDLVLSPSITGVEHPPTLDGFTDLVLSLRQRIAERLPAVDDEPDTSFSHLDIAAELGFADALLPADTAPVMPDDARPAYLPGHMASLTANERAKPVTVVRYEVDIKQAGSGYLMFATPQPVRVWWDGELIIDSQGGEHVPAFHRCRPKNQLVRLEWDAGRHEIIAGIYQPDADQDTHWCVGLSDDPEGRPVLRNWIVNAFRRRGK